MATKKVNKNIKFEDALQELEAQVALLESGELPLEEALEVYKKGIELSQLCLGRLNMVKQEVEKITVKPDGAYETEVFPDLEEE